MMKDFKVALTYASEQRPLVSKVAESLADSLLRDEVFYDKYHEADLAQPNLDLLLQEIYRKAQLLVVFLSADYGRKPWTGVEWRVVRERTNSKTADHRIMLLRVDKTPIAGYLPGVDGSLDIEGLSPTDIAEKILERLEHISGEKVVRTTKRTYNRKSFVWVTLLLLAVVLISVGLWRALSKRPYHALLLVPWTGVYERLDAVGGSNSGDSRDIMNSLRVHFRKKPYTLPKWRQEPVCVAPKEELGRAIEGVQSSRWTENVHSPTPLDEVAKAILAALSREQPKSLGIEGDMRSGEIIGVELVRTQDRRETVEPIGSFSIDGRPGIQTILLIEPKSHLEGQ